MAKTTIRFPPQIHEALAIHKDRTLVPTAVYVTRAVEEKLTRDGFEFSERQVPRRKPARSA